MCTLLNFKSLKVGDLCIMCHGAGPKFLSTTFKILCKMLPNYPPGLISSVSPLSLLLPLPGPLHTLGEAPWGFQLIVSSSGTFCRIGIMGAGKPLPGLSTQLSPWAVSSERKQSLGE